MKLEIEQCVQCEKQLQYFENIKGVGLESMIAVFKLSEYIKILKSVEVKKDKVKEKRAIINAKECSDCSA